eukprot:CAMPEP_0183723122 /NCGR_PEP_ID=MMETSP0737-20130205/14826_1 /TAXON_ID=385413 /ORGANISM="Thalassiosira miniscula, Strain CCMP1093" /LENGTH=815 /DNA_ID=CAMNT_0025953375 /DNA_START=183 /DNA_END=2630 /DNA_ORIENTATION=+
MASLNSALKFLSLPNACPLSIVALNPHTGRPIAANSTFESILGPLYKFKEWEFSNAACEDYVNPNGKEEEKKTDSEQALLKKKNRTKFREAIDGVRNSLCEARADSGNNGSDAVKVEDGGASMTGKIRNVEMLTLGNDAGMPIKRYFDWTIGSVQLDGEDGDGDAPASAVILYGDMVNEVESSNRERDAELIDFFQNAPIAMHWLNGDGIVLWANQTELNVLGYTPEEYIGQPIMNFCPDEQELVLEIFKQLGSGNAIADVPVRFRTKDGKLVHLLIDSNVAYNPDGSFGHTRCFIRDDTARKIRDARTKLLLEENERSLRMLDNFLSKTLHHVMGPLHALRGTCEVVSERLQLRNISDDEKEKNCELLERAAHTVTTTTRMVADVSDLARFDEGSTLKTKLDTVDLRDLGIAAIDKVRFNDLRLSGGDDGVTVSLKLVGKGGSKAISTDQAALLRILAHLLENAVREVQSGGNVTLQITSSHSDNASDRVLVEVMDDGKGLPVGTCLDPGNYIDGMDTRPAPCHRYLIGGNNPRTDDPDELKKVRAKMEEGLRDLKQNGVGVGLPISYHLVRVLGGDLRHDNASKGTRLYFYLPNKLGENEMSIELKTETILKKSKPPENIIITSVEEQPKKRKRADDADFGNFVSSDGSTTSGEETAATPVKVEKAAEPAPEAVAKCGVKASMPFSVLIVEDTDICARLLGMQLKKMKCSTQRAENGKIAVDLLKDSMPGTFDMVLMDLRMPVMDGLEATKLIRDELKIKDLPILALTGEMRDDIRSECEGIGFTEFYQKPLPKKKLQELVEKYKAARDGLVN